MFKFRGPLWDQIFSLAIGFTLAVSLLLWIDKGESMFLVGTIGSLLYIGFFYGMIRFGRRGWETVFGWSGFSQLGFMIAWFTLVAVIPMFITIRVVDIYNTTS